MGFDAPVAPGGYAWWYVDALSDDGRHGLTIIGFIGSVFSPYYAWARRRGAADPENHCAVNVALYGPRANRWAMTERGRGSLSRAARSLVIGPSSFDWDGTDLTIRLDEWSALLPLRIRGTVRLRAPAVSPRVFALDGAGTHRWRPVAPCSRVEVALDEPGLRWSGPAYFDMNTGDVPLEADFTRWSWSRAMGAERTTILYDVQRRDGSTLALALAVDPSGEVRSLDSPPVVSLPHTRWRVERETRADAGQVATLVRTLEDAPFYARSVVASHLHGEPALAVHESLSLDRFRAPIVQAMLPFRMPRVTR